MFAGWFGQSVPVVAVAVTALILGGGLVFFRRRKRVGSGTADPNLPFSRRGGPADHLVLKEEENNVE